MAILNNKVCDARRDMLVENSWLRHDGWKIVSCDMTSDFCRVNLFFILKLIARTIKRALQTIHNPSISADIM